MTGSATQKKNGLASGAKPFGWKCDAALDVEAGLPILAAAMPIERFNTGAKPN